MSLVETGAAHALLVKPDVRVAAVRLDRRPQAVGEECFRDVCDECVEAMDVVEDVDRDHDPWPNAGVLFGEIQEAELHVRGRMPRLRVFDHPGVDVDAEEPKLRMRGGDRGEHVPRPAAELEYEITRTGSRRDVAGDERDAAVV